MKVLKLQGSQRLSNGSHRFDSDALDILMPLHLTLSAPGTITHVAPTFVKLLGHKDISGRSLFDVVEFRRPAGLNNWADLARSTGQPLVAELGALPGHNLKAVAVATTDDAALLLDFSLGAGVQNIVAENALKTRDFSPADLTGEMLYMMEVQSILLRESRDLNNRLNGAKITAEEQAFTDSLTGLNNRRALRSFVARLLERDIHTSFAVLLIDLDHFKSVNDDFGHAAGDHVLQEVSRVLLSETRSTDLVARAGGDEFIAVLSDFGTIRSLREIACRIIDKLSVPISFGPDKCSIGASIGATIATGGMIKSIDAVLAEADAALYLSKKEGRGKLNLSDEAVGRNSAEPGAIRA